MAPNSRIVKPWPCFKGIVVSTSKKAISDRSSAIDAAQSFEVLLEENVWGTVGRRQYERLIYRSRICYVYWWGLLR